MATMEKKGMNTGLFVIHPLTGENCRLGGQLRADGLRRRRGDGGAGARRARLCLYNKYQLPMVQVLKPTADGLPEFDATVWHDWYAMKEDGATVTVNCGKYDGLSVSAAFDAIVADLAAAGRRKEKPNRLRDWGISRQRYWGCPIPIIHCDSCGDVPVPDDQLPVVLPEDVPDGMGSPLAKMPEFLPNHLPCVAAPARRETDTMDTFVESSWYFARYASPDCTTGMVDERAITG